MTTIHCTPPIRKMSEIKIHAYEDQSDPAEPAAKRQRLCEAPNEAGGYNSEELQFEDIFAVPVPSLEVGCESDEIDPAAERLQLGEAPNEGGGDYFDQLQIDDIMIQPSPSLEAGCVTTDEVVCFGTVIQQFNSNFKMSDTFRSVVSQPHMNSVVQTNFHLHFLFNWIPPANSVQTHISLSEAGFKMNIAAWSIVC